MKIKSQWKSIKLTDEDLAGIKYAYGEGSVSQREIAALYRISQAYVSRIVNGKASRVRVES